MVSCSGSDLIVLILVLMDNQNTVSVGYQGALGLVLILVLMDNQNTQSSQRLG